MKILFENWRKFLQEAEDAESPEPEEERDPVELAKELDEKLKNSIKNEINAVLIDYEASARKNIPENKKYK